MYPSYGLSHLQITVADRDRAMRFYQGLFGMEELFRMGDHAVMLRTPGTREVFTINGRPDGEGVPGQMGGIAHFGFHLREETDMAALLEQVASLGGTPLEHGVRGQPPEPWAFFLDPDGYGVEVFWIPDEAAGAKS